MNIESDICTKLSPGIFRSCFISGKAGAIIEEATGEMNVKDETVSRAAHFRFEGQFLGFAGSSDPSQDILTRG